MRVQPESLATQTFGRGGFLRKNVAHDVLIWLYQAVSEPAPRGQDSFVGNGFKRPCSDMKRSRMNIFYSGQVQGVGFRYTVKTVATGFEVVGTVRNLLDGRVELVAEGPREELEAFRKAIREAGLDHFIRNEDVSWSEAAGTFRGFEIAR